MGRQQIAEAWIELEGDAEVMAEKPSRKSRPYDFGYVSPMFKLIRTHKRIGPALRSLLNEVMFAPGHLSRREREMIAAVASAAQDCTY